MNRIRFLDLIKYITSNRCYYINKLKKISNEDLVYFSLLIDEVLRKRGYYDN